MMARKGRKTIQDDASIQASRPLLIFNHNPKAAGGSILSVLRGFKSREIKCSHGPAKAERAGSSCRAKGWEEAFSDELGGVDSTFMHLKEFARTTHFDRLHGFVIGSIREPCSQYLSLWSWGSLGNGAFRKSVVTNPDLYGVSKPYFNTTSDRDRFLTWMKDPLVVGTVGARVKDSYGESVLDTVDCWVFVEDFRDSLLGCLKMYEDQGGFVDWEASEVAALIEQRDNIDEENKHRRASYKKDDALGDPRTKHHGKCKNMFDLEVARQVEEDTEPFVYELFGYDGCCKPGTNFHPRGDKSKNDTTSTVAPSEDIIIDIDSTLQPATSKQGYSSNSIDAVLTMATIIGVIVIIFFRFISNHVIHCPCPNLIIYCNHY